MAIMDHGDAQRRLEELRAWLRKVADDPEPQRARALEMREFAGEIFDADYLDGEQYHLIYDLTAALSNGEDAAGRCAAALLRI